MLTEKQLEQRRAAGQSLRNKVHRDYYRAIGKLGGRKSYYNSLLADFDRAKDIDERYKRTLATELPGQFTEFETIEQKLERYRPEVGTRLMLFCFEPESEPGKLILLDGKRRGPRRKYAKRVKRSAAND